MSVQAVTSYNERILRRQVPAIVNSSSALTVITAPMGFGKTELARQVFQGWKGTRDWYNAQDLDDHEKTARVVELLDDEPKSDAPKQTRKNLLVIDGLDIEVDAFFVQSLLLHYSHWADHTHLVLVTANLPDHIRSTMDATTHVHYLTGDDLRFNIGEQRLYFQAADQSDFAWQQLIRLSDGWPALLSIIRQDMAEKNSIDYCRSRIQRYVANLMTSFAVEFERLGIGILLEADEFDQALLSLLPDNVRNVVKMLNQLGLLWPAYNAGVPRGYRWPYFVRQYLRNRLQSAYTTSNDRYRLIAWADNSERYAEALYFAMQIDDQLAMADRLVRTAAHIQERGRADLIRQALSKLDLGAAELRPYLGELLFISLASFSISAGGNLQAQLKQVKALALHLPDEELAALNTWVLSVQTYAAIQMQDVECARQSAYKLQAHIDLLGPYYQSKALYVLGEFSTMIGELDDATDFFEKGLRLSERDNLQFSYLWHSHQLAQCQTLIGQTNLAGNIRLAAIQKAHEWQVTDSFPLQCLMRAHCEHLQQELKVNEADSILTELEDLQDFVGDKNELPIKLLHLENHRLNCLLNANYQNNIEPTVNAVERALLNDHHVHVTRRAERNLLNLWAQTEQGHPISQWYDRQTSLTDKPNGPDALLHLRNLMFAYLWLKDFGVVRERKWSDITKNDVKKWLRVWPQMASGVAFLWSVSAMGEDADDVVLMQNRAFGWMSQCNDLAEPLAYLPSWFTALNQPDRPLQRFQSTFLSRLKSIRGPKSLNEPVQLTTQAPGLSRREWQFLEQISSGASNEVLATQFNLSLGTVKNHLTRLYRKLGVSGRSAACARYKSMVPAVEVKQA